MLREQHDKRSIEPPAASDAGRQTALGAYVKLMRAAGAVTARVHSGLNTEGVSISQFGVLEALLHRGPLAQCELGQKILKSSGNVTVVVDHLEQRGLVVRERDGADRRRVAVSLTAAGRTLITRLFPLQATEICTALAVLTGPEQQQLARLCKKLGLANAAALALSRNPIEEPEHD
jgi:MarR family transcriptional regulator, 2-MHQ and catechol-resistance regulon repressor